MFNLALRMITGCVIAFTLALCAVPWEAFAK